MIALHLSVEFKFDILVFDVLCNLVKAVRDMVAVYNLLEVGIYGVMRDAT